MSENQQSSALHWKSPDFGLSLVIDGSVVENMNIEIMRGFAVSRRRGTEVGGILLGPADSAKTPLLIKDFEVVPCEYAEGPSYHLSATDKANFEKVVSQARSDLKPIGYFRSHTREAVSTDEQDAALFRKHFGPSGFVLIVKPYATRTPEAAVFRPDSAGNLQAQPTGDPFPFALKAEKERSGVNPAETKPRPSAASPNPANASVATEVPAKVGQRTPSSLLFTELSTPSAQNGDSASAGAGASTRIGRRTLFATVAFTVAACTFGSVMGYQYGNGSLSVAPRATQREVKPILTAGFTASPQGKASLLRWNLQSDVVRAATRAVLLISERDLGSKQVELSAAEVRNGSVIYQGTGGPASFTLELYLNDGERYVQTVTSARTQ